jgi:hypothetical protein
MSNESGQIPYEIYIFQSEPEIKVEFFPLMAGQQMGTICFQGEDVHAVAIKNDKTDGRISVYTKFLGNKNQDHSIDVSDLLIDDNIRGKATPDEKCFLSLTDVDGIDVKMLIRSAGKTALLPGMN